MGFGIIIGPLQITLDRFSHFAGSFDEQAGLGVRQLSAYRHQAAVRSEQQIMRLDIFQRSPHAFNDRCDGRNGSVAWIDAADIVYRVGQGRVERIDHQPKVVSA